MMNYCMECGTKLELRHLENEGEIPFCSQCNQFRFPIFFARAGIINAIRKESRVGIVIRREAIPSLFK